MTNLQAALGLAQLEQLERFVEIKRQNHNLYTDMLADCGYGRLLPFSCDTTNCWFYSFALNRFDAEDRDKLICYMNDQNIQVRPIWKLNHMQTPFRRFRAMNCDHALNFYNRVVNIPCSTNLTREQIGRVCQTLLAFKV